MSISYSIMNIDWQAIQYFLAVAEAGSLSAAARQLDASQPTVGRRIDALESTLGFRLFRRHSRGLQLTQEGTLLLEQARQMLHSAVNIQQLAAGEIQQPSGLVRLSLPEGICHELLIPALPRFRARYPSLRLVLDVSFRSADLTHGEADVALRLFRPKEPDLVVRRLGTMTMGVYAGADYLKTCARPTEPQQLADHPCISYGDSLNQLPENQWLLRHCRAENLLLQSDSTACRLRATEHNLGVSIQPALLADSRPALVRLLEETDIPGHEIWLTYHRDLLHSARTRAVVEFLIELFAASSEGKARTELLS